jgi:hypothetical protein
VVAVVGAKAELQVSRQADKAQAMDQSSE